MAYNEAETAMFADAARTQFGVDRTGRDDRRAFRQRQSIRHGGLAESYGTGDLNPNNPVDVLQDGPTGSTDEGRAMLENIHDVAPGANLHSRRPPAAKSASPTTSRPCKRPGSNIIVDDVGYADEPMFQPGVSAQAVEAVTARGRHLLQRRRQRRA